MSTVKINHCATNYYTMKLIKKSSLTLLALFFCAISVSYADNTIVIKGSDTLGAKMVPQLAEAFKANMKKLKQNIAFEISVRTNVKYPPQ